MILDFLAKRNGRATSPALACPMAVVVEQWEKRLANAIIAAYEERIAPVHQKQMEILQAVSTRQQNFIENIVRSQERTLESLLRLEERMRPFAGEGRTIMSYPTRPKEK
jgi:hypothetical protein